MGIGYCIEISSSTFKYIPQLLNVRLPYYTLFGDDGREVEEYQYAVVMAYARDYELLKYHTIGYVNISTNIGYSRRAITNAQLLTFFRNAET